MVPIRLGSVSIIQLVADLNLINTLTALILVYTAQSLPLAIFILSEFMPQIPKDLREAARCDGLSEYNIFFYIILPLIRPAMATVAVFTMIPVWNDLWFPLLLAPDRRQADHHARRAAVPRAIHHRLERGAGGAVHRHRSGPRPLRRVLAPADPGPHLGRREVRRHGRRPHRATCNKSFGPVEVLKDIDLDVEDGELRRARRPLGLRQVHAAARRSPGWNRSPPATITIGGRKVNDLPPAKREIAMVFQSYALYPHMNVCRQHGLRPAASPGTPRPRSTQRVRDAAAHPAARAPAEAPPARALGRPAPARRHRPRHRAQAAGLPVRRAALQPRCGAAHQHPRRDRQAPQAAAAPPSSMSPTTRSRR